MMCWQYFGDDLIAGVVSCPLTKWTVLMPAVPLGSPPGSMVLDALKLVGAPELVALRMARILGLDPESDCDRLAPGEMNALALGRALLRDPEILVFSAPFAFVGREMHVPSRFGCCFRSFMYDMYINICI